ncbi:MAG: hypothetical protein QOJ66_2276, partial [Ilumatobacteraceae bacterium]
MTETAARREHNASNPTTLSSDVTHWLDRHWDSDLTLVEWRGRLVEDGWAMPSWDARWGGRDLPPWADDMVRREIRRYGAVGIPPGAGTALAGPTIVADATDDLKDRFLRPILTGEESWCQLFSEPGAGSDLAGLTTRALCDGDRWIIDGQKVWSTSAHYADFGMLLARTDWEAPKHRGLTFFILPMRQPGVEVRPLRQMNDYSSFNEVFLTAAEVPLDWVVGEVNRGWDVALTTLAHERRFRGNGGRPPQGSGRALEEARLESARYAATYSWYPQRAGR